MKVFIAVGLAAAIFTGYLVISDHNRLVKRLEKIEQSERAVTGEGAEQKTPAVPTPLAVLAQTLPSMPVVLAPPVASAAAAAPPSDADEAAVDPGPNKEEFSASLDDFFARQPVATASSRTLRSDLQAALGKLQLPEAALPAVDCRGSMCRADFPKLDEGHARELLMQMTSIGWNGPMTAFMVEGDKGQKQVRVFAAAQGAELPLPHG